MLGTLERAKFIAEMQPEELYVGSGAYRTVYRDGDVVYKVGDPDCNREEVEQYKILAKKIASFPGIRLPRTELVEVGAGHDPVVVQEYVDGVVFGELPCMERERFADSLDSLARTMIADMHSNNFMVDKAGYIVPVDFGNGVAEEGGYRTDPRKYGKCNEWCGCAELPEEERIKVNEEKAREARLRRLRQKYDRNMASQRYRGRIMRYKMRLAMGWRMVGPDYCRPEYYMCWGDCCWKRPEE